MTKLKEDLVTVSTDIADKDAKNATYTQQIKDRYEAELAKLTSDISNAKAVLSKIKDDEADYTQHLYTENTNLQSIISERDSWDKTTTEINDMIQDMTTKIAKLTTKISEQETAKTNLQEHLARVKQLDTLTKRDFRGYILSDIIKYLDAKAKQYSSTVFGHTDLNIYLDGNNLDISYDGKMFDNLSGGEKTRVDLIIQFAIRDLLTTYLNAGSNILVLDEVTDFLDATSCAAVMDMIEKELKAVESVFIVSHHADELSLPIDSSLHVCKDVEGISSITQN